MQFGQTFQRRNLWNIHQYRYKLYSNGSLCWYIEITKKHNWAWREDAFHKGLHANTKLCSCWKWLNLWGRGMKQFVKPLLVLSMRNVLKSELSQRVRRNGVWSMEVRYYTVLFQYPCDRNFYKSIKSVVFRNFNFIWDGHVIDCLVIHFIDLEKDFALFYSTQVLHVANNSDEGIAFQKHPKRLCKEWGRPAFHVGLFMDKDFHANLSEEYEDIFRRLPQVRSIEIAIVTFDKRANSAFALALNCEPWSS